MKPDFLCIGAQKSATTWLYMQLKKHPQVWVPPVKELNYFNSRSHPLIRRMFGRDWISRNWRRLCRRPATDLLFFRAGTETCWFLKYLFFPRNFNWYCSLFPDDQETMRGDFSVQYAVLDDHAITQVARSLPAVKIIYLLRNPILRAWSQAKMNLLKQGHKNWDQISDQALYRYFNNPAVKQHSQYLINLSAWQRCLPSEQIFVDFYEAVAQEPLQLLKKYAIFCICPLLRRSIRQVLHSGTTRVYPWTSRPQCAPIWQTCIWKKSRLWIIILTTPTRGYGFAMPESTRYTARHKGWKYSVSNDEKNIH